MTEIAGTEGFSSRVPPMSLGEVMQQHREQVARDLPDIDLMSDEEIAVVLLTYQMVIEPNFIRWMLETWRRCRSEVAIEACRDNLVCEINENHPQMLRTFVAPAYSFEQAVTIATGRARRITRNAAFGNIDEILAERSDALDGLLVMACLENDSIAFIPWLAKAGARLGVTDFTYTNKHGEADIHHANQFFKAVKAEAAHVQEAHSLHSLETVAKRVEGLLHMIFRVHETD